MKRSRPRLKALLPIGSVLSGPLWGRKGMDLIPLYRIQKSWPDLVGADLASRTFPKRAQGKMLIVAVENPAWAQHLSMMKEAILEKIRQKSGREFKDIRFVNEALPRSSPHES